MLNKFCKKPLYEVTRTMARVAMGVQKAETVIKNARLVNVCTAEIQEGIDVAIAEGRIALVGDASHCIGPETKVIDAGGQYIAPGFMDGHIHVDSSMISVGEYAKAVVPSGTIGICHLNSLSRANCQNRRVQPIDVVSIHYLVCEEVHTSRNLQIIRSINVRSISEVVSLQTLVSKDIAHNILSVHLERNTLLVIQGIQFSSSRH